MANASVALTAPSTDTAPLDARVEYVTPLIARRYLMKRPEVQRKLRPHRVAQYARDMRQGRWGLTHQGIAFSSTGHLVDGQHRLAAIIESGVSVDMLVTRGVAGEAFVGMDRGMLRSAYDNAPEAWMASRVLVSLSRNAMRGYEGMKAYKASQRPTDHEVFAWMEQHREALEFASSLFRRHTAGIGQAPVQAVFCRAFYTVDRTMLERCAETLNKGILPDATFSGMGALRSFLTSPKTRRGGGGGFQAEVYAKTERALMACLRGEEVTRLHAATEELFTLPA